jgi:hypothetical protein
MTGRSGDVRRRVFLAALGRHGDILPVIAIAAALQERLIEMPVVRGTDLVRADVIPRLGHVDGTGALDAVVFSRPARAAGVAQYVDNRQVYGYIAMEDGDPAVTEARLRQARLLLSLAPETPAA